MWLLDEALDLTIVLSHDNTIPTWLLNFRDNNGALLSMALMEVDKLAERILANHIRVEDKEEARLILVPQDSLGKLDWPCCP